MNQKQKLGYMALGAVIMLVGLGCGAMITAPLVAQNKGIFDAIECNRITLVTGEGRERIRLWAADDGGKIAIYDHTTELAAMLYAHAPQGNGLTVYSTPSQKAFELSAAGAHDHTLTVYDGTNGPGLLLMSHETFGNRAMIMHPTRAMKPAITLFADKRDGNELVVYDQADEIKWKTPVR